MIRMRTLLLDPLKTIRLFTFAGVVFSVHMIILLGTNWYYAFPQTDIFFHFLGGVAIGNGFINMLRQLSRQKAFVTADVHVWRLLVVALVALAATLWEFHEYMIDYFFHTQMQPSIPDTMLDMFLGLAGGLVAAHVFRQN